MRSERETIGAVRSETRSCPKAIARGLPWRSRTRRGAAEPTSRYDPRPGAGYRSSVVQTPRAVIRNIFRMRRAVHRRFVVPLIAQGDAAAVPCPAPQLGRLVMQAARVGSREVQLRDGAVIAALQDDIDHARDRVGAITGRCAVRENVDAVDCERGNDRRIDGADTVGLRRMAHAIHHHQRAGARGIKAAYVDARQSLQLARGIRRERARRDIGLRNSAEQIRGGRRPCCAEILHA